MKNYYFDNDTFYQHLLAFRSQLSCSSLSASAVPDDYIGEMFIKIADGLCNTSNFKGYDESVKDDVKGYAYEKMTRGLMLYKLDMGPSYCFNYFTRAAYLAALTEIGKYYKHKNLVRDLTRNTLIKLGAPKEMIDLFAEYKPREDKKSLKFNKNLKKGKSNERK